MFQAEANLQLVLQYTLTKTALCCASVVSSFYLEKNEKIFHTGQQ